MPRPVSRADLARLLEISKSAVTQLCAGKLAGCLIGNRIDLDGNEVRSLFASHGKKWPAPARAPTASAKTERSETPVQTAHRGKRKTAHAEPTTGGRDDGDAEPQSTGGAALDNIIQELGRSGISKRDLAWIAERIGPVLERFGTERALRDLLVARKDQELIRKTELENEETEGDLIYRDVVRTQVFGRIEACNRRLLGDLPKSLVARIYALASTDTPPEVAEEVVRDLIGSMLEPMRAQIVRVLDAK